MKTLFEQIVEIRAKAGDLLKLNKEFVTVFYKHKTNEEDIFTNPEEFFNRKLITTDYEKEVKTSSPIKDLKKEIFGDENYEITDDTFKAIESFDNLLIALNEKPVSDFKKEKQKAQAKEQAVKNGTNKSCTEEEAHAELLAVYEKYGMIYKPKGKKKINKPE